LRNVDNVIRFFVCSHTAVPETSAKFNPYVLFRDTPHISVVNSFPFIFCTSGYKAPKSLIMPTFFVELYSCFFFYCCLLLCFHTVLTSFIMLVSMEWISFLSLWKTVRVFHAFRILRRSVPRQKVVIIETAVLCLMFYWMYVYWSEDKWYVPSCPFKAIFSRRMYWDSEIASLQLWVVRIFGAF
jgi:hypothetical protein